jgi:CubicO group peptidase (beta-lactamase class C family)
MRSSYFDFRVDAPWATRVNATHRRVPGRGFERYWDPSMPQSVPFFRAAGGLYCSARDYARLLGMWARLGELEGVRLLSEASVREALEPGPFGRYGMFWDLPAGSEAGRLPWAFGHVGTDGTAVLAVPERDLLLLYFTQSRGRSLMYSFAMRAADAFGLPGPMPKFTRRAKASEIAAVDPRSLQTFVGTYAFGGPGEQLSFELEAGVLRTRLRGEEVHLVPLSSRGESELELGIGWIRREGGGVELRCDEDVTVAFAPTPGGSAHVELRRGGAVRARGTRVDE